MDILTFDSLLTKNIMLGLEFIKSILILLVKIRLNNY